MGAPTGKKFRSLSVSLSPDLPSGRLLTLRHTPHTSRVINRSSYKVFPTRRPREIIYFLIVTALKDSG